MDGLYFSAMASGPAEWISAIGQIVAAAGTLAAVVIALWLARLDGRRIRAELADRDAGQARLIMFEIVRRRSATGIRSNT